MRIGELSQRTGLSIPTLRYYEKVGLFDRNCISRSHNNYRDYNERVVEIIGIVRSAKRAGFTLGEIARLFRSGSLQELTDREKRELLAEKLNELDQRLKEIRLLRTIVKDKLDRLNRLSIST